MNRGEASKMSEPVIRVKNNSISKTDYLDEYDEYSLEHEKYFVGGQGGKQRSKRDIVLNTRYDPSQNVRIITSKLQNFEHNRRK
jgi:hypothetical protein